MSPEKVTGARAEDWRTDYISLGCVLYEMLAGRAPFPADAARSAMTRRTSVEPPEIRAFHPEVPEDVAAIVRRSLATDPSARYPTAGFLRMAIDGALSRLDGAAGTNGVTGAAGTGGARTG
jgi:serine/threonine protein kinase